MYLFPQIVPWLWSHGLHNPPLFDVQALADTSGMNDFGKGGGIHLMDDSIKTNDRIVHNPVLRMY